MRSGKRLALVITCGLAALASAACADPVPLPPVPAAQPPQPDAGPKDPNGDPMRAYIPSTISPEAAAIYARYRPFLLGPGPAIARTPEAWATNQAASEAAVNAGLAPFLKATNPTVVETEMGGVKVLDIRPQGYKDDGSVLIHVHGGGFVYGSARSNLRASVLMAQASGKRIISVDYTVAPKGDFRLVTDQVTAVYKAVLASGYKANHVGMFGESAGGTIISSTVFKIRDQGLPLPAGIILISPATDLTGAGDTRVTLAWADPVLRPGGAQPGIDAYAAPADQKNPYASAVYGDFTKGYPATLIQGGTKEWLLSDMVRLNRAIRTAGGDSTLDLYEGMPHGFPSLMNEAAEGRQAIGEELAFWKRRLKTGKR